MSKVDLTKAHKDSYTARADPHIVNIPAGNFLTILGRGAPGEDLFLQKLEPLYAVAYRIKFHAKHDSNDFVVCKLEGLWWFDDPADTTPPREQWNWKLMIRQPDYVDVELAKTARDEVESKKKLPSAQEVQFEFFDEGLSAQVLHLGPYTEEEPTIVRLHAFIENEGYQSRGLHHEIYLSDPRRVSPDKLRTIIRQPVE
jgi:hypothetical protein